jgi:hypothetical protein
VLVPYSSPCAESDICREKKKKEEKNKKKNTEKNVDKNTRGPAGGPHGLTAPATTLGRPYARS